MPVDLTKLPQRHSDKAPRFDPNHPTTLLEYFEDYEIIADAAQLTPDLKIKHSRRYLDRSDADLWESLTAAGQQDWDIYKTAVIAQYPGAADDERWTMNDLDRLCDHQQGYEIKTLAEFGNFDRQFSVISKWLLTKTQCGEPEVQRKYYSAFIGEFKRDLDFHYKVKFPDRKPHELKPRDDVRAAAMFVLSGTQVEMDGPAHTTAPARRSYSPDHSTPAPRMATVKSEPFDFDKMAARMAAVFSHTMETAVTNAINRLPAGRAPNAQEPQPPSNPYIPSYQQGPRPRPGEGGHRCYMCHDPNHFIGDCPVARQFEAAGKVKRGVNGALTLGDGNAIPPGGRGSTWAQRIEEHYNRVGQPQPVPPQAATAGARDPPLHMSNNFSANLVGVVQDAPQEVYMGRACEEETDEEEEDEDQDSIQRMIQVLQTRVKKGGKKGPPGIPAIEVTDVDGPPAKSLDATAIRQSPQEPAKLPYVAVPPLPPKKGGPPCIDRLKEKAEGVVRKPAPTTDNPAPAITERTRVDESGAAYKFKTPIESGVDATEVIKRTLSEKVILTVEELLALCPDVRKFYKEATTTKRIPVKSNNVVSAFYSAPDPSADNYIEGEHSLPLRTIDVSLNGIIKAEGILDGGCQVIIIRHDIWKKLGMPLRPDRIMFMESANGGSNPTVGMLPRVTFGVGEVQLPCPVQVVEDGPFECLLGRPFTALAEAITKEYRNGDSELTLKDPNTGYVVTIPTQARAERKKPKRSKSATESGFQ